MDPASVAQLKEFIKLVDSQPQLLHAPELAFFKKAADHGHSHEQEHQHGPGCTHDHGGCGDGHAHEHGHGHSAPPAEESDEEPEEPEEPEEEDPDLMAPDNDPPQEMGADNPGEPSDADMEKATELKMAAAEAASNGDHAKAVESFTGALKLMPSPLLYAKRAEAYLKLCRPNAAKRDCDRALDANPDSAKALRIRGSAHRYLANYEAAQADLAAAQRIDYDDSVDGLQKFVNQRVVAKRAKALKKQEAARAKQEKAAKARKEKARREYDEQKQAEAAGGRGGMPGMGGGGGGMPGGMEAMMGEMMQDPEMMQAMSNPKVMEAMQSCMGNPMAA